MGGPKALRDVESSDISGGLPAGLYMAAGIAYGDAGVVTEL